MTAPKLTPTAQDIDVAKIDKGKRLRPISRPHAEFLALSIKDEGQRQPIEIRPTKGGRFCLVSGGHRYVAIAEILGWSKISAIVLQLDEAEARIYEIDENLIRHELNPLDRAVFLAERKTIYERLNPTTVRGKAGAAARHHATEIISFARDVAEKVGLTDRTIRLSVAIALNLTPETRAAIAGTALSQRQSDLVALSKLSPSHQKRAVAGLLAPEPKWSSVREAADAIEDRSKPAQSQEDKVWAAFLRLTPAKQRAIAVRINGHLAAPKLRAAE